MLEYITSNARTPYSL